MSQESLFGTVVVPMDFSKAAMNALELAAGLCEQRVARQLALVHGNYIPVELLEFAQGEGGDLTSRISERAAEALSKLLADLQDRGIASEYFALQGTPCDVILETVRECGADLIVMGTHGYSGLAHLALGSVAERVVRLSPVPVLTVKAGGDA